MVAFAPQARGKCAWAPARAAMSAALEATGADKAAEALMHAFEALQLEPARGCYAATVQRLLDAVPEGCREAALQQAGSDVGLISSGVMHVNILYGCFEVAGRLLPAVPAVCHKAALQQVGSSISFMPSQYPSISLLV